MIDVQIRPYKKVDLADGSLVVSAPHTGVGSLLFTDFVLDQFNMDQIACLDSEIFPPIAISRRGKPRAPARIHADAASKLAVLRCEFNALPKLAAPTAKTILAWAKAQRIQRIIALDGLITHSDGGESLEGPRILYATGDEKVRMAAKRAAIPEFAQGILGGIPAVLLLESRFYPKVEVLALLAMFEGPRQDAQSSLAFAEVLRRLMPDVRFNTSRLEADVEQLEAEVRTLQDAAEKKVAGLFRKNEDPPPMYG